MRRLLAGVLVLGALLPSIAFGQDVEGVRLGLMYQPEYQPGLVILPLEAEGETERLVSPIQQILRQDLDYSDRFEMTLSAVEREPGDEINLELWKERGADWVLEGGLRPGPAGGSLLRLVLYDAVYGQTRNEEIFVLPAEGDPNFRMAVHAVSDQVVLWATGDPGAAATRISFVLEGRGSKEVYVIDSDGENLQRITSDGAIALSPAWSPDGNALAYTSYRTGSPLLYERDLVSGRDRLLSDRDGINITPVYSPDGNTIAFATTVSGNTEIATYNRAQNCCLEQHTRGRGFDSLSPSYSPDGRQFAFVSNRLGEPHIYLMPVGGGEPRLISDYSYGGQGYNASPDFSPVGRKLTYHTRTAGTLQIVVADLDAGTRRLLTNEGNNEDPSWGPDGRHVVFASRDREGGGLFVVDSVSGRVRSLLRGEGYGLPAWSPALSEVELAR